jgi:hypothetical protein
MKSYRKTAIILVAGSFMLSGCAIPYLYHTATAPSSQEASFVYQGINFGTNRDADFKRGVKDGCTTASGAYAKDHASFNTSSSYRTGWENGRLKCKGKK